jgi:hypothetical protein
MSNEIVPESRAYTHSRCGQETLISGQSFEVASNPMSSMERTFCTTCGSMFPISEFAWADTGETIEDYYARHTARATSLQRFLCSKTLMVALIAVAALATAAGCYLLVANDPLLTKLICVATGFVIGAIIGMAVFTYVLADPIKRRVCGVSDTRVLR